MAIRCVRGISAVFAAGVLAACGAAHEQIGPSGTDPQVVQDVVEASFMVPGEQVRRGMRIMEFVRQKGIESCGGRFGSIDGTANRFDQSRLADLSLIRERGLVEQDAVDREDRVLSGLTPGCNLVPDLPRLTDWRTLPESWSDVVASEALSASLDPSKQTMAQCLRAKTGLAVNATDPAASYLSSVNQAMAQGATEARQMQLAAAYADCSQEHFSKLRDLLLKRRPAFVERNRELLQQFASGLVRAGYVP